VSPRPDRITRVSEISQCQKGCWNTMERDEVWICSRGCFLAELLDLQDNPRRGRGRVRSSPWWDHPGF